MVHPNLLGLLMLSILSPGVQFLVEHGVRSLVEYGDSGFLARLASFGMHILNMKNQMMRQ